MVAELHRIRTKFENISLKPAEVPLFRYRGALYRMHDLRVCMKSAERMPGSSVSSVFLPITGFPTRPLRSVTEIVPARRAMARKRTRDIFPEADGFTFPSLPADKESFDLEFKTENSVRAVGSGIV